MSFVANKFINCTRCPAKLFQSFINLYFKKYGPVEESVSENTEFFKELKISCRLRMVLSTFTKTDEMGFRLT
jgi:hypothetical protein